MLFLKILIYLLLFLLINLLVILLIPLKIRFSAENHKEFRAESLIYWIYPFFHLKLTYFNPQKVRILIWLMFFPVVITVNPENLIKKNKDKRGGHKEKIDETKGNEIDTATPEKLSESKPESLPEKIERLKNTAFRIWDQYSEEIITLYTKCISLELEELSLSLGSASPDITGYLASVYYILEDIKPALPIYISWDFGKSAVIFDTSFKIRMKLLTIVIILIRFYSKTKKGRADESK